MVDSPSDSSSERAPDLVRAEYPIVISSEGDGAVVRRDDGMYTQTTVLVRSDQQLIAIPTSFHRPLDYSVGAIIFVRPDQPQQLQQSLQGSSAATPISANLLGNIPTSTSSPDAPARTASVKAYTDPLHRESGTFIQFVGTPSAVSAPDDTNNQQSVVASPEKNQLGSPYELLTTVAEESSKNEGNRPTSAATTRSPDSLAYSAVERIVEENSALMISPELKSTPLTMEVSSRMLKRIREDSEATSVIKPKKPQNAFFLFRKDFHKEMQASGSKLKAKDISELASKRWRTMEETMKSHYQKLADRDMASYQEASETYKDAVKKERKRVKKNADKAASSSVSVNRSRSVSNSDYMFGAMHHGASSGAGAAFAGPSGAIGSSMRTLTWDGSGGATTLSRAVNAPALIDSTGASGNTNTNLFAVMSQGSVNLPANPDYAPLMYNSPAIISYNEGRGVPQESLMRQVIVTNDPANRRLSLNQVVSTPGLDNMQPAAQQYYLGNTQIPHLQSPQPQTQEQIRAQLQTGMSAQNQWELESILGSISTSFASSSGELAGSSIAAGLSESAVSLPMHPYQVQLTLAGSPSLQVTQGAVSSGIQPPSITNSHLSGVLPSIPDIEVADTSASLQISLYPENNYLLQPQQQTQPPGLNDSNYLHYHQANNPSNQQ
ncbi:hypothetical protein LPJ53_000212 [Coemansia erecta]|uniref:HMG box domain-containing protein n=1 Tax=Coemansia erecta TaxID=147472 RepID=A0A9W7Y6P8_9FUNG|nr:hypothetical protein LPJ53_000212 [Coemansia erecta]